MSVQKTGKVDQSQLTQIDKTGEAKINKDNSRVQASDEFVRKSSRHGVEYSKRLTSGMKYMNPAFLDQIDSGFVSEENFKQAFHDVIEDILDRTHLAREDVVNFVLERYEEHLKESPSERRRLKKEISKLYDRVGLKKAKKGKTIA